MRHGTRAMVMVLGALALGGGEVAPVRRRWREGDDPRDDGSLELTDEDRRKLDAAAAKRARRAAKWNQRCG